jgi:RHS repeat-associated protein
MRPPTSAADILSPNINLQSKPSPSAPVRAEHVPPTLTTVYDENGLPHPAELTAYYFGGAYEVTGGTITKYYYARAQRVAMRQGTALYYLLPDHLGSTSLTTDASGHMLSELRYTAWGEVRYNAGVTPTDYTYTGQYSDSYINLLWYGSRHYDPALGRFISPDSIVPLASQGVQAWDRFGYANNNPVRYTDPSGHMAWEGDGGTDDEFISKFRNKHRQDLLFRKMFLGSGDDDAWTAKDWRTYLRKRDFYWKNPDKWINSDPSGIEGWAIHVEQLASHYGTEDHDKFVRDLALVYAGIPFDVPWGDAAMAAKSGPPDDYLNESNSGLDPLYIDSRKPWENQSHHYVGIFALAYFSGGGTAGFLNFGRDTFNPGDVNLGATAARNAETFRNMTPSALVDMITSLSQFDPGLVPRHR